MRLENELIIIISVLSGLSYVRCAYIRSGSLLRILIMARTKKDDSENKVDPSAIQSSIQNVSRIQI